MKHYVFYLIDGTLERLYSFPIIESSQIIPSLLDAGWRIALVGKETRCQAFYRYLKKIKSDSSIVDIGYYHTTSMVH